MNQIVLNNTLIIWFEIHFRFAEYGGVAKNFLSFRSVALPLRMVGVPK